MKNEKVKGKIVLNDDGKAIFVPDENGDWCAVNYEGFVYDKYIVGVDPIKPIKQDEPNP
jgi:hypothetical protein